METAIRACVGLGLLLAGLGCGPVDPPMRWKTWQVRHADASGPGIEIRWLETEIWGRTDYSTPTVLILDADGVTWEIYACGDDPKQWRVYRKPQGEEPVRRFVPLHVPLSP